MAKTPSDRRTDPNPCEHENDLQTEHLAIMQEVQKDTAVADSESANELINCEPQDRPRLLIQHFGKRFDIFAAHNLELLEGRTSADHYVSALRAYRSSLLDQIEKISVVWPSVAKESIPASMKLLLNSRVLHWTAEARKRVHRSPKAQVLQPEPSADPAASVESSTKPEASQIRSDQRPERSANETVERATLAEYQRRMLKKFGKDTIQDRYHADYVTAVSIRKHLRIDHSRFYKVLRHEIPGTREATTLMEFLKGDALPRLTT